MRGTDPTDRRIREGVRREPQREPRWHREALDADGRTRRDGREGLGRAWHWPGSGIPMAILLEYSRACSHPVGRPRAMAIRAGHPGKRPDPEGNESARRRASSRSGTDRHPATECQEHPEGNASRERDPHAGILAGIRSTGGHPEGSGRRPIRQKAEGKVPTCRKDPAVVGGRLGTEKLLTNAFPCIIGKKGEMQNRQYWRGYVN